MNDASSRQELERLGAPVRHKIPSSELATSLAIAEDADSLVICRGDQSEQENAPGRAGWERNHRVLQSGIMAITIDVHARHQQNRSRIGAGILDHVTSFVPSFSS